MTVETLCDFSALPTTELELRLMRTRARRGTSANDEALADELAIYEIELELQRRALAAAQAALAESHARYERLYDLAPVGYLTLSRTGVIRQANLTAAALLGMDCERLPGWPLISFVDRASRGPLLAHLHQCGREERATVEITLRGAPPPTVQVYSVRAAGAVGAAEILTAITDVTDRKRAEDALRTARDGLERRVQSRTAEIERTNFQLLASAERAERLELELRLRIDDLARADRNKDEFLAMLAHELRNPLAPIQAATEVLRYAAGDPARIEWVRTVVGRQIAHLRRLVDDLLDLSRITLGKFGIIAEPVELRRVVDRAIEVAAPLLESRRHRLVVRAPEGVLGVRGDRERLTQAIANLVHNAGKYTPEAGEVTVETFADGETAVVRVADTGEGMSPELLRRVFDAFEQGDRSLARTGGLGIGLTLARRIAELHGGTLTARSEGTDRGSVFELRLPRHTASPEVALAAAPVVEARAQSRRVLLVEDNADALETLAALLRLEGHEVRTAADAHRAVDEAVAFRPEVALLDIGLPGMSGYELARHLRALPETHGALLVALSGYGRKDDFERSSSAGFDDHLVKPVDPSRLSALIARGRPQSSGQRLT